MAIDAMKDTAILEKKYQAIEDFTRRLLASEVGDSIAKIVLFGSVRKGEARTDSDIDVLVLATRSLDKVKDVCLDIAFEINMDLEEGVEPMVYCLDMLRYPCSYFVYYNLKTGEEIYKMDDDKLRQEESLGYLELAEEYLKGVQRSLSAGDYRIAVDAGYNAAELCAKGFLILKMEDIPSSHSGIVGKFGELYVRTGTFPKEMGRRLNRGLWLRNQARYERHARIGEEEAREVIEMARELSQALSSLLESSEEGR